MASTLESNIASVRNRIDSALAVSGRRGEEVTLIAVSKRHPIETIRDAAGYGLKDFGENRSAELAGKARIERGEDLAGIRWHMIGHLQSNKVKSIIPFVDYIHSVDRISLASEISRRADEAGRTVRILLQVNISEEPQKSGVDPSGLDDLYEHCLSLANVETVGLMGMASFISNEEKLRRQFSKLRSLRDRVAPQLFHLSMGMSNDFEIAIEEGATMIRVGTAIFGERPD